MKLAIFDPQPVWNPYVSAMYLDPLEQFARAMGVAVKRISDPIPEFGWTMLCNAGHLNRDLIRHFHANKCPLVAISCNDSAYLTEQLNNPDLWLIPLVFTISGVQKTNFSQQSFVNEDMTIGTREVQFLPSEGWEVYHAMHEAGRLLPLPYVPWDRLPEVPIPAQKTPKILFRGGNHFWRFVAYLHALKAGVAHPASGFLTEDYFRYDMVPQFQYCARCRAERSLHGRLTLASAGIPCDCPDVTLDEPLSWNNCTPRKFFKFAQEFGIEDMASVENVLNFKRQSPEYHLRAIADAAFFCEAKWEFSIPFPQRFWEAASVNTVNLAPRRVNDQEYFPHMEDGQHYWTFANDFSDLKICEDAYRAGSDGREVAANARALYEHWIKPGPNYVTNENLLHHILNRIMEVSV